MSCSGRRVLVTGGGRGIGAAIARAFVGHGAEVIISGRSREHLEEVAGETGATVQVCDLSSREQTDRLIDEIGAVDILVNNAGIAGSATLSEITDESWDRTIELNATAPFRLIRGLVPAMSKAGWGRVINIASNAGLTGYGYTTAYCASKHALIGMTRALAVDLATTGVTINAICPGWVETDMARVAVERIASKTGQSAENARKRLEGMSPQKRMIAPEEVAHVALMLASEQAAGVHGQAIVIDGGQVMK